MLRRRRSSEAVMNSPGMGTGGGNGMNATNETNELMRFQRCRGTIICFHIIHWSIVLGVLISGMMQNGGDRKYVPVDPVGLANLLQNEFKGEDNLPEISCLKAYVDVHTESIKDELAYICCDELNDMERYQSYLCNPRVPYFDTHIQRLPFSKRLTRFPEAWVLPMLPIIIRLIYQLISSLYLLLKNTFNKPNPVKSPSCESLRDGPTMLSSASSSVSEPEQVVLASSVDSSLDKSTNMKTPNNACVRITLQRLLFYFIILNIRGWGLYVCANAIEDYLIVPWFTGSRVISPLRTNSVSDVEHNIQSLDRDCWYKDVLKAHHRSAMESDFYSDCYGRPFDFSDHIVLFLAHYLPIFVMEILYCWMYPFWASAKEQGSRLQLVKKAFIVLHLVLFFYMHAIVLNAVYQTTAYFHTTAEIIVGYLISWFLQCPLLYLFCSGEWTWLRQLVGLPVMQTIDSSRGLSNHKGD